jgi:periplasmic divalent cation tolerance protein
MIPIVILWTCKDLFEARTIAKILLEKRLIACASLLSPVESLYRWEGKIEEAKECKVFLKTSSNHFENVKETILAHSSYEVPEILELKVERGNPAYLEWLIKEIS